MKKLLFLFVLFFILTGCSSTVNINIKKDIVDENITVTTDSSKEYNEIKNWDGFPLPLYYDQDLENPYGNEKEEGVSYYETFFDDTAKTLKASASFSLTEHPRSSLIRNCFEFYNAGEDADTPNLYRFATSEGLICKFTNFNVVVTTPYLVKENNAMSVNKDTNTYTWNITNSNKKNIYLSMVIDFSHKYNETSTENTTDNSDSNTDTNNEIKKENNGLSSLIIIVSIIFILLIIFIYLKIKNSKASKL